VLEVKSPMLIFKIRNHVLRTKEPHAWNHGLSRNVFFLPCANGTYSEIMEYSLR
jgi:hypothetical protein